MQDFKVFIGVEESKSKTSGREFKIVWLGSPVFRGVGCVPNRYFFVSKDDSWKSFKLGDFVRAEIKIEDDPDTKEKKYTCFGINKIN